MILKAQYHKKVIVFEFKDTPNKQTSRVMHENLLAISRMYTEEERTKMIFKNKEGRKAAWERKEREEKGRLFY